MLGLSHGVHTDTVGLAEIFSNLYSLQFNGSTESVQIDTVTSDMDNRYGSFLAWIKPENMSASTTVVEASVDANNFIRLWWNEGNTRMKATIKQGGTGSTAQDDSASHVADDDSTWYHVAMTWDSTADGGNGEIKLYVNSVLQETTAIGGTWSGTLAAADIAKNSRSDTGYFKGYIDEVAIYKKALTPTQMSTLYNGGSTLNYEFSAGNENLIGYWRFTEGSGTSSVDESGEGNTGTLINTPTWSTETP
jgi:hypothetical protein|tara:strand:+ start:707 stop:1453 length:747 start_codon:yes stop_codon:yes gene_type:complete